MQKTSIPTYKNFSMVAVNVVLGTAPIIASFFSPLMKIMMVGTLRIPYWVAIDGVSSVLNLKHLSFPAYSFASSPTTGWIVRQGPHHGAQNSTNTGPSALRTSEFHVLSVTVGTSRVVSWAWETMPAVDGKGLAFGKLEEAGDGLGSEWTLKPLNSGNAPSLRRTEMERAGLDDIAGRRYEFWAEE